MAPENLRYVEITNIKHCAGADLMADVAAGSESALAELYDACAGWVYHLASARSDNQQQAEALSVETFTTVWRNAAHYESADQSVVSWIGEILRAALVNRALPTAPRGDSRASNGPPSTHDQFVTVTETSA